MTDTRGQSVQFQRDGLNLNDSLFSAQSSIWDSQTLLSWQSAPESPSESIFQWQYDRVWESPATERDRIVTDRPHLAEATSTVGLGTIQLETGYSFSSDSAGGVRTRSHSFPESLLRVGVFAEWFELRLAGNYLIEQAAPPAGPTSTIRGSDDVYVGAKVALFKQYGWLPDFTVFPQALFPLEVAALQLERFDQA